MAGKKRKKRTPAKADAPKKTPADKQLLLRNVLRLLVLIAVTLAVYIVYRLLVDKYFYPVMISYTALAAVSTLAYVIYNRGFSRKGITAEMLPDTMSDAEKEEFIEDGKRRIRKSRPLFIVAFAFIFTFLMDILELIALPFFKGLFGL